MWEGQPPVGGPPPVGGGQNRPPRSTPKPTAYAPKQNLQPKSKPTTHPTLPPTPLRAGGVISATPTTQVKTDTHGMRAEAEPTTHPTPSADAPEGLAVFRKERERRRPADATAADV